VRHLSTHAPNTKEFREDVNEFLECRNSRRCPCKMESSCIRFVTEKLTDGTIFIVEEL